MITVINLLAKEVEKGMVGGKDKGMFGDDSGSQVLTSSNLNIHNNCHNKEYDERYYYNYYNYYNYYEGSQPKGCRAS